MIVERMSGQSLHTFLLKDYYRNRSGARLINKALIVLLSLLILCTPLPFGSVQPLSVLVIELISVICLLLWITQLVFFSDPEALRWFRAQYRQEKQSLRKAPFFHRHFWLSHFTRLFTLGQWPRKNIASNIVDVPQFRIYPGLAYHSLFGYPVRNTGIEGIALFGLVLLSLQLIPLPHSLIEIISPSTSELYRSAADAAGIKLNYYPLSLNTFLTFSKILEYSAYFMIYLVTVNSSPSRTAFRALLLVFTISATFQAGYGLFEFLSGHQHIFTYKKKFNLDCATGTFINRNHYAVYLEMAIPIMLGFIAGRFGPWKSTGKFFIRILRMVQVDKGETVLLSLLIILSGLALFSSLSRSGIAFGVFSCATFFFLFHRADLELTHHKVYWIVIACIGITVAVFIGLNPLLDRFRNITEELSSEGPRWRVWRDTADIFIQFPLTGTGAGTFAQVFPIYQSFVSEVRYLQTHNDYLQFLSEGGITVLFICLAFFALLYARLRKLKMEQLTRNGIVRMGAFCSLLSLSLHSFTDFGLQMPAIPVAATILLALFMISSERTPRGGYQ